MKDDEYFTEKLFCYAGQEVKKEVQKLIKEDKLYTNLHYAVDDALRLLLKKHGIPEPAQPKKPSLV